MNLSLIPNSTRPAPESSGALARVYTKDGRSIRVPLRAVQTTTCTTCSQKPERQFMRWFTRQSTANPGFPVMVKSILLVSNQQPCANCQRILTSFLYRYNLAGKLRLGTLQSGSAVSQQRMPNELSQEFDQENDQEFSRLRRVRPTSRTTTGQRSRMRTLRSPILFPRRRSVVRILRRPLITGYQTDLLSDRIYNIVPPYQEPAYTQDSPVVDEPTAMEPTVEEPVVEEPEPPATNDEIKPKGRSQRPTPATFTAEAGRYLRYPKGLTMLANQIKGRGQMRGATVEIVLARLANGRPILVAGINSSATWAPDQLTELRRLGVNIAPQTARGMPGAPHAEENMAAHLITLGARGERWSKAVVGARGSYVCYACRRMVARVGGVIED